jgi:hypothetical protein
VINFLNRDAILKVVDLPVEEVHVPEWKGSVRVQGLTGTERDAFEASIMVGKGKDKEVNIRNLRAKLVCRTMVDEKGHRIFSDSDIPAIGNLAAVALQRVFEVAQRLSGLSDEDVEELAKNSDDGQSVAFTSA